MQFNTELQNSIQSILIHFTTGGRVLVIQFHFCFQVSRRGAAAKELLAELEKVREKDLLFSAISRSKGFSVLKRCNPPLNVSSDLIVESRI